MIRQKLQINQQGGTNQTNVNNSTFFMGYLLGIVADNEITHLKGDNNGKTYNNQ